MSVYVFLRRHLPEGAAVALTGVWFGLLIFLVIYCSLEPQAAFRYGEL